MANSPVRFDGRVAVITGSGGGLGRCYALTLGALGAKVVVNDVGATLTGASQSYKTGFRPADIVVDEIRKLGGVAVANYDSVEFGEKIIDFAIKNFGRIDILVNNAGILRDVSFRKMTLEQWEGVLSVHIAGSFKCTKAAWQHMEKQNYGRIVMASSASGIYGNFGQTNYSTAKAGLIGFTQALAKEGSRKNIFVNVIAPIAGTRMTETIWSKELVEKIKPEFVAPIVAYLCSERCTDTGELFEVGASWAGKLRWERSIGYHFPSGFTVEDVAKKWNAVRDFTKTTHPQNSEESYQQVFEKFDGLSSEDKTVDESNVKTSSSSSLSISDAAKNLKCSSILESILKQIEGPNANAIAEKANFVYKIDILPKKGADPVTFTLDLKSVPPKAYEGSPAKFDASFSMLDSDFTLIMTGKLNPQVAFMQGKMKIKGNMRAATKFTPSIFQQTSKL